MNVKADAVLVKNRKPMVIGGSLVIMAVLAILVAFVALPARKSQLAAAAEPARENADTARWVAIGEFYSAQAEELARATDASTARWVGMGELYAPRPAIEVRRYVLVPAAHGAARLPASDTRRPWITLGTISAAQP